MTEGLHRMRAAGMRTARVEHDVTNGRAALYESPASPSCLRSSASSESSGAS
jgi:hypothetical protein